jgi:hypothetical protein
MNREDIIRMAREACDQAPREDWNSNAWVFGDETLERFAALVAAAERNKLAAWMIERGYATGHGDTIEDLLQELDWQIREQERELIARSMDKQADLACDYLDRKWAQEMAAAIRARGER